MSNGQQTAFFEDQNRIIKKSSNMVKWSSNGAKDSQGGRRVKYCLTELQLLKEHLIYEGGPNLLFFELVDCCYELRNIAKQ